MAAPFAALEADANEAILGALANATATLPGGAQLDGILEDAAIPGGVLDVMPAFARRFTAASAALATVVVGAALIVGGDAYEVVAVEPDGTGLTALGLK